MAEESNTTNETPERVSDIIAQLREAGVDRQLTMRVFNCIDAERAKALSKAARLFYRYDDEPSPITLGRFSDELNAMSARLWGVLSAVTDALDGRGDSTSKGVMQLVQDAATEMERLSVAFAAERDAQS
jgi:hypothetical protein